jgi:hypothetical protein
VLLRSVTGEVGIDVQKRIDTLVSRLRDRARGA